MFRQSSAAVATSREGHRSPRSGRAGQRLPCFGQAANVYEMQVPRCYTRLGRFGWHVVGMREIDLQQTTGVNIVK
jgi:hypothetical protein